MIQGRDLLEAAQGGYACSSRAKRDNRSPLYHENRDLTLKIRAPFTQSPQMTEMAQIFRLKPGLSRYKVKSELQPNAEFSHPGSNVLTDTIYLNLEMFMQIMTFIPGDAGAMGVADGVTTLGADGQPFDWTTVTAGNFFIASSKHCPKHAEVKVFYRDHWFYIRKDDVSSRSVLAVLEILFSLQESDEKTGGPVLTLPAGGR